MPLRRERFAARRRIWPILTAAVMAAAVLGCERPKGPVDRTPLQHILETGELTVVTRNNAHCYYLYRDEPMGFEYDLVKAFADSLGVRLRIEIGEKWDEMIPNLTSGSGDLIAASMTITPKRAQRVSFSRGYLPVQQHIVVRRGGGEIARPEDLAGRTVTVRKGTSYQERLEDLQSSGIPVRISLVEDVPTEELIRQVAEGVIEATVADTHIALLNRRYYPLAVPTATITDTEYLGWAVRPGAHRLLGKINGFFDAARENGTFDEIYRRYFGHVERFDYLDVKNFHRRLETHLPRYLGTIRTAAEENGLDWRLVAAQIYQESHFDPNASSHAGAYGLMQLSPATAESLGVSNILDPEENIRAGVRHLRELYDTFDKAVGQDRILLALAAYNIGLGHLWDARNLARKRNLDPNRWSSLKKTLPLLRYRKHHRNSRYGYARGTEPVVYVDRILDYYDILKHQDIEYPSRSVSSPRGPGAPLPIRAPRRGSTASPGRWTSPGHARYIPSPSRAG